MKNCEKEISFYSVYQQKGSSKVDVQFSRQLMSEAMFLTKELEYIASELLFSD